MEIFALAVLALTNPEIKRNSSAALDNAARVAAHAPESENSLFAGVLSSGIRSDYLGLIEKRYAPALREMKTERMLAEKLLARNPDCADAWVAIGVEKGRHLARFTRLMLAAATLRENNPSKATQMLEGLVRDYPRNPLYAQELARLQLGVGNS